MKLHTKITIIPSRALGLYCLERLVGREGVVVENRYDSEGTYKGSWVKLDGAPYRGEQEWYIPRDSISIL